jgi:ELWxxDGT repeat protein
MYALRLDFAQGRHARAALGGACTAVLLAAVALAPGAPPSSAASRSRAALVKDIKPGRNSSIPNNLLGPSGGQLTAVGRTVYFGADDGRHGYELWRSNGTARGTRMVKDIRPGPLSSQVFSLTDVGGTLFFTADDGVHGSELWRSDGTARGTDMVKDINPGLVGSGGFWLTAVGRTLYLFAYDGTRRGLWRSDGTEAGTVFLKELVEAQDLTAVGGSIYFAGSNGTNPLELWRSDGTSAGTAVVDPGAAVGPYELTDLNGIVFFGASDPLHSSELWRSDGAAAGTYLVRDINTTIPAAQSASSPHELTAVGSNLYFVASPDTRAQQIWRTDGTAGGTLPIASASFASELAGFRGRLFFTRTGKLWRTEGRLSTAANACQAHALLRWRARQEPRQRALADHREASHDAADSRDGPPWWEPAPRPHCGRQHALLHRQGRAPRAGAVAGRSAAALADPRGRSPCRGAANRIPLFQAIRGGGVPRPS